MGTVELKSSLHQLIDDIQNTNLLESLHEILSERKNATTGMLWSTLSNEQKNEVIDAFEESEDRDNLTPHSEILRRFE